MSIGTAKYNIVQSPYSAGHYVSWYSISQIHLSYAYLESLVGCYIYYIRL